MLTAEKEEGKEGGAGLADERTRTGRAPPTAAVGGDGGEGLGGEGGGRRKTCEELKPRKRNTLRSAMASTS